MRPAPPRGYVDQPRPRAIPIEFDDRYNLDREAIRAPLPSPPLAPRLSSPAPAPVNPPVSSALRSLRPPWWMITPSVAKRQSAEGAFRLVKVSCGCFSQSAGGNDAPVVSVCRCAHTRGGSALCARQAAAGGVWRRPTSAPMDLSPDERASPTSSARTAKTFSSYSILRPAPRAASPRQRYSRPLRTVHQRHLCRSGRLEGYAHLWLQRTL